MQFALTPAQRTLQTKARELACGPIAARAAEIDRTEEYPWDNVASLTEARFFGMTIPTAYGGRSVSYLSVSAGTRPEPGSGDARISRLGNRSGHGHGRG